MKGQPYKIMFGLIEEVFMGLLISIVKASNHLKCMLLSNQKCMTPPNEYSQEFHYYQFCG